MKYILLENSTVKEIIPEYDPALPNFPLEKRYTAAFIDKLMPVDDETEVYQNWVYDEENGSFAPPPQPEEPQEEQEELSDG